MRQGLAAIVVVGLATIAAADPRTDALATDDPRAAVAAIEQAPADAEALFAAGRVCETTLHDPARALALYDRILRERPDARTAVPAGRRATVLRAELGAASEFAHQGEALARLIAQADQLPATDVVARATALANTPWPGAADAMLWLAAWLQRSGRFAEASDRYAEIVARWPGEAAVALRGAAGCALEAHDWAAAEALAGRVGDRVLRDSLLAAVAQGRRHGRWYELAWGVAVAALVGLLASLAEVWRGGRPSLRPPIEIVFVVPIAAVLIAVATTANRMIAPAVTTISLGGLGLAWLSGLTLDTLRARGRRGRLRVVLHVALCCAGVAALAYIALMRGGLLELVIETVRFGPD